MTMTDKESFRPDWVSSPSDSIVGAAKDRRLTLPQLGQRLELSREELTKLVAGDTAITIGLARKLTGALGGSVEFWMSRDYDYRRSSLKLRNLETEWLANLPIDDMVKFGWLRSAPKPAEELASCLRYFGVRSVSGWMRKYEGVRTEVAFRTSPAYQSSSGAVAAWLRQGELETDQLESAPWSRAGLHAKIPEIRALTRQKDPQKFLPALKAQCATVGVGIAVVRSPRGCHASGAVRFVDPTRAIIQLSFRYLSDDHFWFTLFHEIGHLVLHDLHERILLERSDNDDDAHEEREANEFAGNVLIPEEQRRTLGTMALSSRNIVRFARQIGISPGIVVGQLQHLGRLRYNQFNSLKRRFAWAD